MKNTNWKHIKTVIDGNSFELEGLNVWDYSWTPTNQRISVEAPSYRQEHKMSVYEIQQGDKVVRFAAGEFSNCVWGFYQKQEELLQTTITYLRTTMATDWPKKEPWQVKLIKTIQFFIPKANPGYDSKMHLVKNWLIEFVEEEGELIPWREIALDAAENIVFAGPDATNYGFWLDTDMKFKDFKGEQIDKVYFEKLWNLSGIKAKKY